MILADSFLQSPLARESEFSTNNNDKPLIVQFAAKTPDDFSSAAEMVAPYCDGVDLNCGCPQRWAMKDGYGADLLKKPELVRDLVHQVRNRISRPFTISVKIRLLKDIKKTINLCKTLEKAGVSFLTIHARTPEMRNEPIDLESLKTVYSCVQVPVIANGDVKNLKNAKDLYEQSNCQGIMAARGILTNPALFSGSPVTPLTCIQNWLDITSRIPTQFLQFHHHLVFMLEKLLSKKKRQVFNTLQDKESVLRFLEENYGVRPGVPIECIDPVQCKFINLHISKVKQKYIYELEADTVLSEIFQE
ncbi:tRNA-dihydrouridine(20a/20b) synthase [NAD(P)+]-like isoform X2 [Prorops nasuta]